MSAGSPKFTVRRIAALSLVSLWLAGCSDTSNPPAPVSSVNGNAPANTNSGMLITPPPKMGTTSTAQQPQIQPVQQPQIQATQQPQIQPVQPVAQQPVQMENGRIVYNRQYGNIPKGSYSGSTYTVKKGDTLFYIAWITGNDFRDLAQRNNIQAPYALNVGQTLQVGNASTPYTVHSCCAVCNYSTLSVSVRSLISRLTSHKNPLKKSSILPGVIILLILGF